MSSRIKVFYFVPTLEQGGAERQVLELVRRLPARFEPVLCLYEARIHYRDLLPPDQPRHVLGSGRMTLASFSSLVEAMRAERPHIVHCYLDRANLWGRLAALGAGVPVIISSCRARMMEPQFLLVERALSERCQQVVVNSVGVQRELTRRARVRPARVRVIHNFLDLHHFRPPTAAERRVARRRWELYDDQRALLMPGRISLQKHQLGLLLALDRLARAGELPDQIVLLLPGRGRGATVDRWVARIAGSPRLRAHVRLLGNQEDIRSLYWAADVLALPSLWEGLPNAALEGCACGLPALLSRAANLDGIVEPGVTGWQVPTGDHRAVARLIRDQVCHASWPHLQEMGRLSRLRVERRFAPERILREVIETYDQLLAAAPVR